MGNTEKQSMYELLGDSQKNILSEIKRQIYSSRQPVSGMETGEQVIGILESWLMDDEQKQNLLSNVWDIFFLYAASSMLDLLSMDRADPLMEKGPPENFSAVFPAPEPSKTGYFKTPLRFIASGCFSTHRF